MSANQGRLHWGLDHVPTRDLVGLIEQALHSDDHSDRAFIKACRDEIARRKPDYVPAILPNIPSQNALLRELMPAATHACCRCWLPILEGKCGCSESSQEHG